MKIKMSDFFNLPVRMSEYLVSRMWEVDKEAIEMAVNNHDRLVEENEKLKALLKEASDYLDTNKLTTICSSSVFHQQFKEASNNE